MFWLEFLCVGLESRLESIRQAVLYDLSFSTFQDVANQSVTSVMGNQVEAALKKFEHISMSTNKVLDYGHVAGMYIF